jgi:hypothetical protein
MLFGSVYSAIRKVVKRSIFTAVSLLINQTIVHGLRKELLHQLCGVQMFLIGLRARISTSKN